MKRSPFIIEPQGVASVTNARTENTIWKLQRPNPVANAASHFIDGKAIRGNGVPNPDEFYRRYGDIAVLIVGVSPQYKINDCQ
jgi:hypothetical protein